MSSFYYCNDCKKPVDLEKSKTPELEATYYGFTVCKECGSTNWKAIIDTPSGEKERVE